MSLMGTTTGTVPCVIVGVVTQHAEEAAFLWILRDAAVSEPHFSLKDLADLDERIEAHLDGLRIAGDAGWQICVEQLDFEEAGEVFAAGYVAFASDDMERIQKVIEAARASTECARGLVSALGWLPYETVAHRVEQLLTARDPVLRRIGVAAAAIHRHDPGVALAEAAANSDPAARARALRAAGELGRTDLLPALREQLTGDDAACRLWAAWSAALLGETGAVDVLRERADLETSPGAAAFDMALRRMDLQAAHAWREDLAGKPETIRNAIVAAGVIGDPATIPWLIEQMIAPDIARVAGEAFTMITGVDLAYQDLETDEPEGFAAGPTEEPEDEDVAPDPDEDLPWPDSALIGDWWGNHRNEFAQGVRHLVGKPMTDEWLSQVLRTGLQRQRAAAALELVIRQPGTPLFEIRAPGFRQQKLLAVR